MAKAVLDLGGRVEAVAALPDPLRGGDRFAITAEFIGA